MTEKYRYCTDTQVHLKDVIPLSDDTVMQKIVLVERIGNRYYTLPMHRVSEFKIYD